MNLYNWNSSSTLATLLALFIISPIVAIFYSAFLGDTSLWPHLFSTVLPRYVYNTIVLMIGVGIVSTIFGVSSAWVVTRYNFLGKNFFEWALLLPAAVPAYIIAYTYTDFLEYAGPLQKFLREIFNSRKKYLGENELSHLDFIKHLRKVAENLSIKDEMLKRYVNFGFSGGEKKRFEILQMALLNPKISVLDETDSGLDVDALKIVSEGVNNLKDKKNAVVVITHYQRLLDYIKPDIVHIMSDGKIIKSGDADLALYVEKNGYSEILNEKS